MTKKTLEEIAEDFELFSDWEERYAYLIELGQKLEPLEPAFKDDAHLVNGCISKVWLVAEETGDGRFHFQADSDAQIVRGLVYLLLSAYEGKTPGEILKIDIEQAFERLGLSKHLSPSRRNGFFAMVGKVRETAAKSVAAA